MRQTGGSRGRHVGPLDRRDRRSLRPQLVTIQVGTSDPACPGRDESRPYIPDGGHLLPLLPTAVRNAGEFQVREIS